MRKKFIQHPETLELIPAEDYYYQSHVKAVTVMGDIQPYKSMIDGSMITSRSQHREHLRAHNCIEIGNETKYLKNKLNPYPSGLKDELIRQVNNKLR